MSETTINLVSAIASGDAVEIENSFNAAMAEKISSRLDDMRLEVAKNMFNQPEEIQQEEPTSAE